MRSRIEQVTPPRRPVDTCICPECGKRIARPHGVACANLKCPVDETPMMDESVMQAIDGLLNEGGGK